MNIKSYLLIFFLFSTSPLWAREFPLCLYGVNNTADLKIIKKAGFSCIQTYTNDVETLNKLANKASKNGLKIVFRPDALIGTMYEQKASKWPILAWYLVDEPDVNHWSRERVIQVYQAAKQAWPEHATALVIGQGKTDTPYYDIPDVMMMDWYPVPHLPLTSFGDNVRYVKEGLAKMGIQDHPIWGVVQIFDWKNYKQFRPDHDRIGRFPTMDEIRFMSYDGILNGATGLFYFTFHHQKQPLPQIAPEYWARVKTVVRELAKFKKIIENGTVVENPVLVHSPLKMQTWQYKGHLYFVVLNASAEGQPLPAALQDKAFKTLYGGKKASTLPPYAVLVLKK